MPAEASQDTPELVARRRATDATVLKFPEARIKAEPQLPQAFHEGDIEVINLDISMPGGDNDDFDQKSSPPTPSASTLTREQIKARVLLAQYKQSFETFDQIDHLMQVRIMDVKRGDVIAIKTIVGIIYLSILDRLKGLVAGTGEILCECHYDLGDKCDLVHTASIQLPICTKTFTISLPDGTKRNASRQLKVRTSTTLPGHVAELLNERYIVDITLYANPKPEKPRLIDFARWIIRVFLRLKAVIEANNQYEREKKLNRPLKNPANSMQMV